MKLNLKDKIVGRPIRCNKQKLNPKKDTKYAEVVFVGDVHYGSPQCNLKKFLEQLDYCLKHKIYVFLMGDLLEMATRTSVGAGIYEQETIGQSQYEKMVGFLHPLADKKLILGMHAGNHEDRVYQATGIDISKAMAKELEIPYIPYMEEQDRVHV